MHKCYCAIRFFHNSFGILDRRLDNYDLHHPLEDCRGEDYEARENSLNSDIIKMIERDRFYALWKQSGNSSYQAVTTSRTNVSLSCVMKVIESALHSAISCYRSLVQIIIWKASHVDIWSWCNVRELHLSHLRNDRGGKYWLQTLNYTVNSCLECKAKEVKSTINRLNTTSNFSHSSGTSYFKFR